MWAIIVEEFEEALTLLFEITSVFSLGSNLKVRIAQLCSDSLLVALSRSSILDLIGIAQQPLLAWIGVIGSLGVPTFLWFLIHSSAPSWLLVAEVLGFLFASRVLLACWITALASLMVLSDTTWRKVVLAMRLSLFIAIRWLRYSIQARNICV